MAVYEGKVAAHLDAHVLKDGIEIVPRRLTLMDDAPDGFSWGHAGYGSHQLALTLLIEEGFTREEAIQRHHGLCMVFVALLDSMKDWTITSEELAKLTAS